MEVKYPFQTSCKVLSSTICFLLSIYINPFYTFAKFESPSQTVILCTPFFCDTWNQLTFLVNFQQTIHKAGQVFVVFLSLCVQNVESFQLTACLSWNYEIFDLIFSTFLVTTFAFCARTTI